MTDINDGRQASQAAESSHCNPTGRGPLPLRSGPRAVPALSAPSVPRLAVGVSLPERTPTPQQGAPRGRTTAETPLRSRDALTHRNWPGRKRCRIKRGGHKCPSRREHRPAERVGDEGAGVSFRLLGPTRGSALPQSPTVDGFSRVPSGDIGGFGPRFPVLAKI